MSYLFGLLFRAAVLFHLMHATFYTLNSSSSTHLKDISGCGIYLYFIHLSKNEICYPWVSIDDKEWAIGWMQLDLLFYKDVSLVISIGKSLLAK